MGVGDLGGPDKNFFSIQLSKHGIDPVKDVDWRLSGNLLQLGGREGRGSGLLSRSDPIAYLWLKDTDYKEVASNLDGEYKDKTCCIVGFAAASCVRSRRSPARSRKRCSMRAMFTSQNPDKAAASFQPYAPKAASLGDLQAMVRYHTHHHHRRYAQAGTEGLCGRSEDGACSSQAPTRQNSRSGSMSTYSASKAVACRNRRRRARFRGPSVSFRLHCRQTQRAVFASFAWVGFGLSCRWWVELRIGHGP